MNILMKILDVIMPCRCPGCKKSGIAICDSCLDTIEFLERQECPGCRKENFFGDFCGEACRKRLFGSGCYFDQLIVCSRYDKHSVLKKLIENFKYQFSIDLADVLGEMILSQFQRLNELYTKLDQNLCEMWDGTWIVPVPLHKKRLRDRGYNQAHLLSFGLSGEFDLQIVSPLKRIVYTPPQAHLKRDERLENLKNAFELDKGFEAEMLGFLRGRNIVLVDDVCTTGATLNECAKVLKEAGSGKITALVLARGDGH